MFVHSLQHSFTLCFSPPDLLKPCQLFSFTPQAGQSAHFALLLIRKKGKRRGEAQKNERQPELGISNKYTLMSLKKTKNPKKYLLAVIMSNS